MTTYPCTSCGKDRLDPHCAECYPFATKYPTTQAEARQYAIDWQAWAGSQAMSMGELIDWQTALEGMAHQFDLVEEFKENGII